MKHFALIDGKLYYWAEGDYHPVPFDDVLEIYQATLKVIEQGTKALEETNGNPHNEH